MPSLVQDARLAARIFARSPGFTTIAVLSIALGIGANTTIFSVVDAVVLQPLSYRDSDRLMALYEKRVQQNRLRNNVSQPDYLDWRAQNTVFESMSAVTGAAFTLMGSGEPEFIRGAAVAPEFFHMVGVAPQIGRDFLPGEDQPGAPSVILLSHGLWKRSFGSDPNIVGRTLTLSGRQRTVVGVLPEMPMAIRGDAEIFQPFVPDPKATRGMHNLDVYARLKPGVTLEKARAEMAALASNIERANPDVNKGHSVNIFPLQDEVVGNVRPALLTLLGAVGLVLTIACANVANLLLARAVQRRRETSIRIALGAEWWQLARQHMIENLLLSLAGGATGLMVASWTVSLLQGMTSLGIPRLQEIEIDGRVLLFTFGLAVVTGLVLGFAPSFYASRVGMNDAMKQGTRGSSGSISSSRTRSVLVIGEVALALVLAVGAGLLMQSFLRLSWVNPGFDAQGLIAADIIAQSTPDRNSVSELRTPSRGARFFEELLTRLEQQPGVVAVATTSSLPLGGADSGSSFLIEGRPPVSRADSPNARYRVVSPGYVETMKIPLRAGRTISAQDKADGPGVVLINETLARTYFPGEDPLGKRIKFLADPNWLQIVGILSDVKHYDLAAAARPEVYLSQIQNPETFLSVVVRGRGDPSALAPIIRREVSAIDRSQAIIRVRTGDELLSTSVALPRFYSSLMLAFSLLALVLASCGIYGVISYGVAQRTREIGIRMALGARASDVLRGVLGEGLALSLAGVAAGIAGSLVLTRFVSKLLFGVTDTDPATFVSVPLVLIAVGVLASYIPARRATRIDPAIALRDE